MLLELALLIAIGKDPRPQEEDLQKYRAEAAQRDEHALRRLRDIHLQNPTSNTELYQDLIINILRVGAVRFEMKHGIKSTSSEDLTYELKEFNRKIDTDIQHIQERDKQDDPELQDLMLSAKFSPQYDDIPLAAELAVGKHLLNSLQLSIEHEFQAISNRLKTRKKGKL